MLAWLWNLIVGDFYRCPHDKWVNERVYDVFATDKYNPRNRTQTGVVYVLRCEECGEIKSSKITVGELT